MWVKKTWVKFWGGTLKSVINVGKVNMGKVLGGILKSVIIVSIVFPVFLSDGNIFFYCPGFFYSGGKVWEGIRNQSHLLLLHFCL